MEAAGATVGERLVPPGVIGGRRFRLRFAAAVTLVALVPLVVAAWAVGRLVSDNEVEKTDASLNGIVQAAGAELAAAIARTRRRTREAGQLPDVQRALLRRDAAALASFARTHPNLRFVVRGRRVPGPPDGPVIERARPVKLRRSTVGTVVGWVAIDSKYVADLSRAVEVPKDGGLLVARGGRVLGGLSAAGRVLELAPRVHSDVTLGGVEYRAVASEVGRRDERLAVVAVRSREPIESAASDAWWNALWAALATLASVGLLAYVVAPGAAWRWKRQRRRRGGELGPLELEALAASATGDESEAPAMERVPRRVVVIDDDPLERALIAEALEAEDVRVTATADAERALDLLDAEHARLAVLDWKMSGRSGAEILAELNIRHPDVRVVVIADGVEAQQRHVATLLGAEDFLVRPLSGAAVAAKIMELIELAQPSRAAQ